MSDPMSDDQSRRWPVWKLALLLYPFATGALAVNLFLVGLMAQAGGLPNLAPATTLWISLPLGIMAAWLAGRWVRHLMDEADKG